jgi:hypothetical protein
MVDKKAKSEIDKILGRFDGLILKLKEGGSSIEGVDFGQISN